MIKKYEKMEKLHYIKTDTEKEYKNRINSQSSIVTELNIFSESYKKEIPLFYMFLPEHVRKKEEIYMKSKDIEKAFDKLPNLIKLYTLNRLFVNEILYTNEIEGVYSTKKAIYSLMQGKENSKVKKSEKLIGIIQKYKNILENNLESIEKTEDFRKLYDNLFVDFLKDESYKLDGKLFRANRVDIINSMGEVIHSGISGEDKIKSELEKWIKFMGEKELPVLVKACIGHFFLEYIHPFYDGNGRYGRYLFSMYLAENIDRYTALSVSYAISKNKMNYYKSFKNVENKYNKGEITFFVGNLLNTVIEGQNSIIELLSETIQKIGYMNDIFEKIRKEKNLTTNEKDIFYVFIQDYLFNGFDRITNQELAKILKKSLPTINKYINELYKKGLIVKISQSPLKYEITEYIKEKL